MPSASALGAQTFQIACTGIDSREPRTRSLERRRDVDG